MLVTPAIIPESIDDLEAKLLQVKGIAKWVQIDACDGRLTRQASWPYVENRGEFEEILGQERGFPLWEYFDFEIDLMVLNPGREYEQWIDAGASRIIFHYKEGAEENLLDLIRKTKERGVGAGLALHLNDPVRVADVFKKEIDCLQFMGINRIGSQGEPFEEAVIEKVREAKSRYPELQVSVDGGVNFDSAEKLVEAGTDRLVVGSAIFHQGDVREAYNFFHAL